MPHPTRGIPPPSNRDRGLEGTKRNTREPQGKAGPPSTGRRTPDLPARRSRPRGTAGSFRAMVHMILDNYATHKHKDVPAWLAKHPRFQLHFTPTSSSWLNLVSVNRPWTSGLARGA